MAIKKDDPARKVGAILDALSESLLEATDEEIRQDLEAIGVDPLKVDEQMRFSIEGAVDTFYRTRWESLRRQRNKHVSDYSRSAATVPTSPAKCRALLGQMIQNNEELKKTLTAEFRGLHEVDELSDFDVVGIVRNLAALGLLSQNRDPTE